MVRPQPMESPLSDPTSPKFTILPARTPTHLSAVVTLFSTYATSLPISLDFQDFATELASLPGAYSPPGGEILLAYSTSASPSTNQDFCQPSSESFSPLDAQSSSSSPQTASETSRDSEPEPTPVAILALRPLPTLPHTCELKRLYVLPSGRGLGIGRALVISMLEVARERGYKEVRLDTLGSMEAALRLYRGVEFRVVGR